MASVMNFCARRYLSVSAAKYSGTAAVSGSHEGKFSESGLTSSFEVMHLELCNFQKVVLPAPTVLLIFIAFRLYDYCSI